MAGRRRSLTDGLLPDVLQLVFGARVRRRRGKCELRVIPRDSPHPWDWADRVRQLARLLVPYLDENADQSQGFFSQPFGDNGMPPGDTCLPGAGPIGIPGVVVPDLQGIVDGQVAVLPVGNGLLPDNSAPHERQFDFDQRDRYYSRQAAVLPVEATALENKERQKLESLTVGYLDSEPVGLEALASGQIDWFGLRVRQRDQERRLILRQRTDPLEVPSGGDEPAEVGPPNLLLIVDSSGSMKFRPDAADPATRGQYDIVLRACYGIFAYIKEGRLGQDVHVACINFSRSSITSGWHKLDELREVKKVLLRYQGGGTQLNPQVVRKAFESRPGSFLAVMITDGCLGNVPAAVNELRRVVDAGCDLALFHVGSPNAFTDAVADMGSMVHILKTADDLIGLTLRTARHAYAS